MKVILKKQNDLYTFFKIQNGCVLSLTENRIYEVLGIEADSYRLLNDPNTKQIGNEPVLFDSALFEVIDSKEPDFWRCSYDEDGDRYCYPKEWNGIGFFEDYFDGLVDAKNIFLEVLKSNYPDTFHERF